MKLLSQVVIGLITYMPMAVYAGGNLPVRVPCDTDCGFVGSAAAAANSAYCVPLFPQPAVSAGVKNWCEGVPNAAPYGDITLSGPRYAKPFTTTGYREPESKNPPVLSMGKVFDQGARRGLYLTLPYGHMYWPVYADSELEVVGKYDPTDSSETDVLQQPYSPAESEATKDAGSKLMPVDDPSYKKMKEALEETVASSKNKGDGITVGDEIIVDDLEGDVELQPSAASWNTSLDVPGAYKGEAKIAKVTGEDNVAATYYVTIPESGMYEVQMWWIPSPAPYRSQNVPVILHMDSMDISKVIDQTNMAQRKQWNSLGRVYLTKGDRKKIATVTSKGLPASETETISIDAIRLVKVQDNI